MVGARRACVAATENRLSDEADAAIVHRSAARESVATLDGVLISINYCLSVTLR